MESKNIFGSVLCAVALIVSAAIISFGFKTIAKPDRTVSVRGLAEREVDADLAVWPLTYKIGSNYMSEIQSELNSKTAAVLEYLKGFGLDESDWTVQAPEITDNKLNPYLERRVFDYIAQGKVLVRSSKVQAVKKAQAGSLDLADKGIAVGQDYGQTVTYEFTKLNDIKPEMIAQATASARTAAEQFAHDSGSKVGKIKSATQGLFTIENAAAGLEEKKSVRVVTTVVYLLKD
ncbi:MAG: SIMPL domain-containing protein [Treponema sp.]|nr:SIMPL domain-containing protein [Treponema sp.]